jgi:hypothetical protein
VIARAATLAAAITLLAPAVAGGQSDVIVGFGGDVVRQTSVPVTLDGGLSVDFHSDAATCAVAGRCGLSGTVSWRPARKAQLYVIEGKRSASAFLFGPPGFEGEPSALITAADVQRSGAAGNGICADGNADAGSLQFTGDRTALAVGLGGREAADELLTTRCAGPRLADVRSALPARRIPVAALRRGQMTVDLRGEGPFAAGGFGGTVRSDLVLHLGRSKVERNTSNGPGPRGVRERSLEVRYRVASVTGGLTADVAGLADPAACGPLDACGLRGTETLAPRLRSGTASLYAYAPATRPPGALRAAVGLAPGGRGSGVQVFGNAQIDDRGEAIASIGRAGEAPCTDRVPLESTILNLAVRGTSVDVGVFPYAGQSTALRTRCPGPPLATVIAKATVPLRAFGRPRVTLRLRRGVTLQTDGYTARTRPDLTVVLERTGTRVRIEREPRPPS